MLGLSVVVAGGAVAGPPSCETIILLMVLGAIDAFFALATP